MSGYSVPGSHQPKGKIIHPFCDSYEYRRQRESKVPCHRRLSGLLPAEQDINTNKSTRRDGGSEKNETGGIFINKKINMSSNKKNHECDKKECMRTDPSKSNPIN